MSSVQSAFVGVGATVGYIVCILLYLKVIRAVITDNSFPGFLVWVLQSEVMAWIMLLLAPVTVVVFICYLVIGLIWALVSIPAELFIIDPVRQWRARARSS